RRRDACGCRRHRPVLRRRRGAGGALGRRVGEDERRRASAALAGVSRRAVHRGILTAREAGDVAEPTMRKSGTVTTSFTALRQRVLALLGSLSMYRLVLFSLMALGLIALVLSALGVIVSPSPLEI